MFVRQGLQVEKIFADATTGTQHGLASHTLGGRRSKIVLINLMPDKARTERHFANVFAASPCGLDLVLVRPATHRAKTTSQSYLERFYCTWNEVRKSDIDGVIITGAPVETLPFEDVTYWRELTEIFNEIRARAIPALYICWAAQAALYNFHCIPKHMLEVKASGIFSQQVFRHGSSCVAGLGSQFNCPVSRHTETRWSDIAHVPGLHVAAAGVQTGLCLVEDELNRTWYMFNHLEYGGQTLTREFQRDFYAGKPVEEPQNLMENTDPGNSNDYSWRDTGTIFFANWIKTFTGSNVEYIFKNK